ncbi:RagB/SusD family nutrient uptake outer membrane protein [Sphingobacterium oryzagri]|uniref:RagB/SusD family nutrient uptake outer membrane protein n=1 Tax=Sphingobacterium oryzagri TaxID=3025669 RepID=A0ABY7WL24_9SPHI|nr:RagB/SusD family nutrient uptake outer membrane protein [Sphingobacterium sp. KACC 22765]WDF69690.1 RagB/SusD family nutrient uptake outer membrane protein [Sphingobacterium sp. KACC 22765]
MNVFNNIKLWSLAATLFVATSCDSFLTEEPTSDLTNSTVVQDVTGLNLLLQGTYRIMRDGNNAPAVASPLGLKLLSTVTGLDMMVNQEQVGDNWYFHTFSNQRYEATSAVPGTIWTAMYKVINNANIILDNVDQVQGNAAEIAAIKGQALALRARCYFNLVRLYQHTYSIAQTKPGVPLQLTADLEPKARATVAEVYAQIVADLTQAVTSLADYNRPNLNFYNSDVAHFLLAQVYLTMEDWANAQAQANQVRTGYALMTIGDYAAGFSTPNKEWVLGYEQGTQDFWWYDSPACWFDFGQNNAPWQAEQVLPSNSFVTDVMAGDPRLLVIENPLYPGKYAATKFRELRNEPPYGNLYDLRAAEMYLVEAEAAARQGNVSLGLQVLNMLQNERGAAVTTTTNQNALIDAILLERRKEMWGEGLEWFDILRLKVPVVRTLAQGHYQNVNIPQNSNKLIMMIPEKEVINNSLIVQNPNPDQVPVFVP